MSLLLVFSRQGDHHVAVWKEGYWNEFEWGASQQFLAGASTATSSTSGQIAFPWFFAGHAHATSSAAATLTLLQYIDAAIAVTSVTAVGDPFVAEQLTGACHAVSVTAGGPTVAIPIEAAAGATSACSIAIGGFSAFGVVHTGRATPPRRGSFGRPRTGRGAAVRTGTFIRT